MMHLAINKVIVKSFAKISVAALLLCLWCCIANAQMVSQRSKDSMIALLTQKTDPKEKVYLLNSLSRMFIADSLPLSDYYGNQQIMVAEESRDPWLIITAYLNNGVRYRYVSVSTENFQKSLQFYGRALAYAESQKNFDGMALSYTGMASLHRGQLDYQKALDYNNKANALLPDVERDSVKVSCYVSMGNTYNSREEKLSALQNFLNGLQVAELSKKPSLVADCYGALTSFYTEMKQFPQARDYAFKMLDIHRKGKDNANVIATYNTVAGIFMSEKQYDMATQYYEKAFRLSDSAGIEGFKFQYNINMLNLYMGSNQMAKGAAYFQEHPEIAGIIEKIGLGYQIDVVKAAFLMELKKYDSAAYYFKKAEPLMEARATPINKYSFYNNYASYFSQIKNYPKALEYLTKANAIAESGNDLEMMQDMAKELDTAYARTGNSQQSVLFKSKYYQYKDSLSGMAKAKELVGLQLDDEKRRQARLAKEKAEKMERKHNIQLMGLAIGIFSFLCLLLMLGRFKVSETLIKILSFIALIFLFEFIILIADQQIHAWTHGEPIKVILIKVFIAGVLLPLHHIVEHKMIHYLTTRNKIKLDAGKWSEKLSRKKITIDNPHV
jgi:tetratricopeptide (TPR) repeat protein